MEQYIDMALEFISSAAMNIELYMVGIAGVITALVALAKVTPWEQDDKAIAKIKAMFDKLRSYLPKPKLKVK